MKVTLELELGNAAFVDDMEGELRRVFGTVADKVMEQLAREPGVVCDAPEAADVLLDVNGNTVGSVKVDRRHRFWQRLLTSHLPGMQVSAEGVDRLIERVTLPMLVTERTSEYAPTRTQLPPKAAGRLIALKREDAPGGHWVLLGLVHLDHEYGPPGNVPCVAVDVATLRIIETFLSDDPLLGDSRLEEE